VAVLLYSDISVELFLYEQDLIVVAVVIDRGGSKRTYVLLFVEGKLLEVLALILFNSARFSSLKSLELLVFGYKSRSCPKLSVNKVVVERIFFRDEPFFNY
jgi:hypothetical protein